MGHKSIRLLFFAIVLTLPHRVAWGYVPTLTSSGLPVRWKRPVKLSFVGNPQNQCGLAEKDFFQATVTGLQRWKTASNNQIQFDYWQGTDPKIYPPNSNYNGISSIYFASNANGDTHLSPNILGMTQVWYNSKTGEILEADIALNDKNFYFTNNPKDTSGYGSGNSTLTDGKSNVYIQNVITHELGHALGLSHSGGLQSTMIFMESPEQSHLGCDDRIAIHALYPTANDPGLRGKLTGSVVTSTGDPVFGAHVVAISQQRGTVLATVLTDHSGNFAIDALEPGYYYLMAEPFYAGPSVLPQYYSQINSSVCPINKLFERSFLTQDDGFHLKAILVESGKTSSSPALLAHCDKRETTSAESSFSSESSLPILYNERNEGNFFGVIDHLNNSMNNSDVKYYHLGFLSGHMEIHTLAYGLYSPIYPSLSLFNLDGTAVRTQNLDPIYIGDSGYVNHDTAIIADGLSIGDYILQLSTERLQANDYPAGPISLDKNPFIVLTGSVQQTLPPPLASSIPVNARCLGKENFPTYASPSTPPPSPHPDIQHDPSSNTPPRNPSGSNPGSNSNTESGAPHQTTNSTPSSQNNDNSIGSCSSTTRNQKDSSKNITHLWPILGWFLPWFLMVGLGKVVIHLHALRRPANLKLWEIH